jgi:large subunit ribosomal protein LP0
LSGDVFFKNPNHLIMVKGDRRAWKSLYFQKLVELVEEYPKCFVVNVDNVGSNQMQQIRSALRGHAVLLMGKNTMMRKAIRGHLDKNPSLEKLLPHLTGNVGLVFTNDDLVDIRDKILANKKTAPAKAGAIAPLEVTIPAQNTGLGPEKTSFFQALNIGTKITKGTIEILTDVRLIKEGDRVGLSEATLLNMLKISPFFYGLKIAMVYEAGSVYEPHVLDLTMDDLRARFLRGAQDVAAVSLAIGYPTVVSVPHMIINGFKNLLAIAAETEVSFKEAEQMKELLSDPEKLAAAMAAASGPAAAAVKEEKKEEKKKEEKKEESEEEEDDDMGFGLFD